MAVPSMLPAVPRTRLGVARWVSFPTCWSHLSLAGSDTTPVTGFDKWPGATNSGQLAASLQSPRGPWNTPLALTLPDNFPMSVFVGFPHFCQSLYTELLTPAVQDIIQVVMAKWFENVCCAMQREDQPRGLAPQPVRLISIVPLNPL